MARSGCPCSMACMNLCMPQAGQLSPVSIFIGHLGAYTVVDGFMKYRATPTTAATPIIINKRFSFADSLGSHYIIAPAMPSTK